jgi:hypothetical protein
MKPTSDIATALHQGGDASFGASSVALGTFRPGSARCATFGVPLKSLPPSDREWSSARARRVAAPTPGPGGVLDKQISRLDEANREWFIWRFSDDA